MQKLLVLKGSELVLLHQCAYGAVTRKDTGILTTAAWMKLVRSLCHEVREHFHEAGGLSGFASIFFKRSVGVAHFTSR